MTQTEIWIISGMAIATFLCRYPLMAVASRVEFPPRLRRVLNYVGPAVLAAVIAPEIFTLSESPAVAPLLNARLGAGLVSAWVAWKTHNVWLTIATGILALILLRALLTHLTLL